MRDDFPFVCFSSSCFLKIFLKFTGQNVQTIVAIRYCICCSREFAWTSDETRQSFVSINYRDWILEANFLNFVHSSIWRIPEFKSFNPPINYDDMQLFCGGIHQKLVVGGNCGVCGDRFSDPTPRADEMGGKYYKGIITGKYTAGSVRMHLSQYHHSSRVFTINIFIPRFRLLISRYNLRNPIWDSWNFDYAPPLRLEKLKIASTKIFYKGPTVKEAK